MINFVIFASTLLNTHKQQMQAVSHLQLTQEAEHSLVTSVMVFLSPNQWHLCIEGTERTDLSIFLLEFKVVQKCFVAF